MKKLEDKIELQLEKDKCVYCPYFVPAIGESTFGTVRLGTKQVMNYIVHKSIVCANRGEKCEMMRKIHEQRSLYLNPSYYLDGEGSVLVFKLKQKNQKDELAKSKKSMKRK